MNTDLSAGITPTCEEPLKVPSRVRALTVRTNGVSTLILHRAARTRPDAKISSASAQVLATHHDLAEALPGLLAGFLASTGLEPGAFL